MVNGKRIKSSIMDLEIPLPEESIQLIQSFLETKEAAQSCLISKSWYRAWLTRPDLDFSSSDFPTPAAFWEWAKNKIRNHELSNLKIGSFRLNVDFSMENHQAVAGELIARAMKMAPAAFTIQLSNQINNYPLPAEVLASENLTRLSLRRCKIHRAGNILNGDHQSIVKCSKLMSISLTRVTIEGDMFWDIIKGCPHIQEMVLGQFHVFFHVDRDYPTLKPYIDFQKPIFYSNLYLISHCQFHKLRSLVLEKMVIYTSFFDSFSTSFPCLKDFSAHYVHIEHAIKIFSPSLERVTFVRKEGVFKAKFDFPNLVKFTFLGHCVPNISFATPSKDSWDFDMTIVCCRHPYASWFLNLKRFFTKLRLATISLSLKFRCTVKDTGLHRPNSAGNTNRRLSRPAEVETLTVQESSLICSTLLDCMFQNIQPRFINYHWLPESCRGWNDNKSCLKILREKLIQLRGGVDVERFEENVVEWQPMRLATLFDSSANIPETQQKIRFCLKWQ